MSRKCRPRPDELKKFVGEVVQNATSALPQHLRFFVQESGFTTSAIAKPSDVTDRHLRGSGSGFHRHRTTPLARSANLLENLGDEPQTTVRKEEPYFVSMRAKRAQNEESGPLLSADEVWKSFVKAELGTTEIVEDGSGEGGGKWLGTPEAIRGFCVQPPQLKRVEHTSGTAKSTRRFVKTPMEQRRELEEEVAAARAQKLRRQALARKERQRRIIASRYPSGVLTSEEVSDKSVVFGENVKKEKEKMEKERSVEEQRKEILKSKLDSSRLKEALLIGNTPASSSSSSSSSSASPAVVDLPRRRRVDVKRTDDPYLLMEKPEGDHISLSRLQRLHERDHGGRDFDVITGKRIPRVVHKES